MCVESETFVYIMAGILYYQNFKLQQLIVSMSEQLNYAPKNNCIHEWPFESFSAPRPSVYEHKSHMLAK
jgi:hypothetical protein